MLPKVRYAVRQRCFVNGCLYDPSADPKRPTYIFAAPGLEGGALELAPEGKAPPGAAPNPHDAAAKPAPGGRLAAGQSTGAKGKS